MHINEGLFDFKNRQDGLRKLTRYLETEGCFTFERKKSHLNIRISLGLRNIKKVEAYCQLLKKLDYKPKIYHQEDNGNKTYHAILSIQKENFKLIKEILPFMWHEGRINNILFLITNSKFDGQLNCLQS